MFGLCIIKTGSKMFCRLESKSSGAFNFIVPFVLNIVQWHPKPHYKMTPHVTSQIRRKSFWEKDNINLNWSLVIYVALNINNSVIILLWKPWIPDFRYSVFNSLEYIYIQNQDNNDRRSLQRVWRCRQTDLVLVLGCVKISSRNRPLSKLDWVGISPSRVH